MFFGCRTHGGTGDEKQQGRDAEAEGRGLPAAAALLARLCAFFRLHALLTLDCNLPGLVLPLRLGFVMASGYGSGQENDADESFHG